jgi:bifunctional oligoribonuclease and PAP phosphatase NrnA
MEKEYSEFSNLIQESENTLITSHKGPDYDSIGSTLALLNFLEQNFEKNTIINFEDPVERRFSLLEGFEKFRNEQNIEIIKNENIDLIILLDGNNWKRFVKEDWENLKSFIESNKDIKTVCIDHHPKKGFDDFDLYIQRDMGSTAEIIYDIFIDNFGYEIDKDTAYCIMTGILGDTGRFLYAKDLLKTFNIAKNLVVFDQKMIEKITFTFERYNLQTLEYMRELMANTVVRNNYTFSYYSDKTAQIAQENKELANSYADASVTYVNTFIRTVEENHWGFVISRMLEDENRYRVSFRSIAGTVDTSIFARKFPGGGGHMGASGCDFEADNVEDAIEIIENVIEKHLEEATL